MVGLIVFMDDLRQFGFPLLERDAFRQFVFINCAEITARRGIVLSLRLVNLLFLNVFCRIIFCHFSISLSVAKIYNFIAKKKNQCFFLTAITLNPISGEGPS